MRDPGKAAASLPSPAIQYGLTTRALVVGTLCGVHAQEVGLRFRQARFSGRQMALWFVLADVATASLSVVAIPLHWFRQLHQEVAV